MVKTKKGVKDERKISICATNLRDTDRYGTNRTNRKEQEVEEKDDHS